MKLLASLLVFLLSGAAVAEPITVVAGNSELLFDGHSPAPVAWNLCMPACATPDARRAELFGPGDGYLNIGLATDAKESYQPRISQSDEAVVVSFTVPQGELSYRLSRTRPELRLQLPVKGDIGLATGDRFVPQQLSGFGEIYSHVLPVQVSAEGQRRFDDELEDAAAAQFTAAADNWTGVRNRYWTMLLQPQNNVDVTLSIAAPERPVVLLKGGKDYRIYAGPVEWRSLKSVGPRLSEMMFAALWDFLRALTFGMQLLLDLIYGVVGNYGLAIVLLSLSVKILMYPLTRLADGWQQQVNEINTLLKPELVAIRREYKGEDAHNRILQVYKKHGISQFYTFKSAAGFLIQIPVFIAAFDMLGENFALNETSFLWIVDLAKPDHLAALPWALPFFGGYLNLLPFLMTFLSALAALLQREASLSADLQRQQSLRLYLMSAAFFVLFYTFPAGMVLYWTSSNLFHLLKVESGRWFVRE